MAPHVKSRSQQSTLLLGHHSCGGLKDVDNLFLIHFTATNKVGRRFRVKHNFEKGFTKFLPDGKTTLSIEQPPHDLLIRCDWSGSNKIGLINARNGCIKKCCTTKINDHFNAKRLPTTWMINNISHIERKRIEYTKIPFLYIFLRLDIPTTLKIA